MLPWGTVQHAAAADADVLAGHVDSAFDEGARLEVESFAVPEFDSAVRAAKVDTRSVYFHLGVVFVRRVALRRVGEDEERVAASVGFDGEVAGAFHGEFQGAVRE